MGLIEVFITALALSVDAFVCSVISGKKRLESTQRLVTGLTIAGSFGFFQFLMPVIGFVAGITLQKHFASVDHWVAFGLLALVALNMLKEAFTGEEDEDEHICACKNDQEQPKQKLIQIGFFTLLAMAVGTSIDALAVGVSYGLLQGTIFTAAAIIGVVCAICSFNGFFLGQALTRFSRMDPILNVAGALVLIGIGCKILIEHQAFAGLL